MPCPGGIAPQQELDESGRPPSSPFPALEGGGTVLHGLRVSSAATADFDERGGFADRLERTYDPSVLRAFPKKIETIDDEMLPFLRAMSGVERLQVANRMYLSACRMLTHHLTAEHADWSVEQVQAEVARRIALGSG